MRCHAVSTGRITERKDCIRCSACFERTNLLKIFALEKQRRPARLVQSRARQHWRAMDVCTNPLMRRANVLNIEGHKGRFVDAEEMVRVKIHAVNMKIGRNAECPCGSGLKHKHCCLGRIDWATFTDAPLPVASRHFTIRGKNLQFISSLLAALKIDYNDRNPNFAKIKRAFTPDVVQKVYSSILDLWPDLDDYERCLA